MIILQSTQTIPDVPFLFTPALAFPSLNISTKNCPPDILKIKLMPVISFDVKSPFGYSGDSDVILAGVSFELLKTKAPTDFSKSYEAFVIKTLPLAEFAGQSISTDALTMPSLSAAYCTDLTKSDAILVLANVI
ncbi:TPA: hypothetical protein ACU15Y_002594 [Escherichia coli]|uniref:hypothetical protein n=1 Tax=Escherichia coli TaxID=562 RepID=UPI001ADBB3A7|nr:hypothetical protein [Escherichia coli]MBO9280158.1 hypothetical protein [Escherichia coli]MBO9293031.1 hypothetical protein [Escherichia coli]